MHKALKGLACGSMGVAIVYGALWSVVNVGALRSTFLSLYALWQVVKHLVFRASTTSPLHAVARGAEHQFPILHSMVFLVGAIVAFLLGWFLGVRN